MTLEDVAEAPLPFSIIPVVFLSGSDYDMGRQYGQQLAEHIACRIDYWWARASRTYGGSAAREAILRDLNAGAWHIKTDAPELVEMLKGMAEGVTAAGYPVTYNDMVMLNAGKSLKPIPEDGGPYPPIPEDHGCAHLHAWGRTTKDGTLISSDNRDESFTSQVCLIVYPETGNNYLTVTDVGQVASHPIMNNQGVFLGGSSGPGARPVDKQYGLPRPLAYAHMGRFMDNACEAKDWVQAHKCTWSKTINFSMADVNGNAFVCEHSPAVSMVRNPGDFGEVDFIFASNNYLLPETRATGDDSAFTSEYRNRQVFDFLRNFTGQVDVEFFKMIYRNGQAQLPSGYGKKEGLGFLSNKDTTRVVIAQPDNGDKGIVDICTGSPSRGTLNVLPIHPTFSFYQMTLAANPAEVTSAAKAAADWSMQNAWPELMKLNEGDTPYAPLSALLSQARQEYYKGCAAADTAEAIAVGAREAPKEQNRVLNGRAATHFARCQAKARQVCNALVPPATEPEDLGLVRPWPYIRWERPPHETAWEQIQPKAEVD